jgi:hypothetical protein
MGIPIPAVPGMIGFEAMLILIGPLRPLPPEMLICWDWPVTIVDNRLGPAGLLTNRPADRVLNAKALGRPTLSGVKRTKVSPAGATPLVGMVPVTMAVSALFFIQI